MVLDECPALPAERDVIDRVGRPNGAVGPPVPRALPGPAAPVPTTGRGQVQFGIVQGGVDPELRHKSAALTVEVGFEGYAIGGLSVGEPNDTMYKVIEHTAPAAAGRSAALPDGRGHADRPGRGGGPRAWTCSIA